MLWVNQITLVSYLFRSCVVFHLTAQNWRQPFWQYVNLFQITRYLDDFRIFDTNMFSSSSESTNCPYLWACQNHIMTVLQCSNEILRILPQQIVYFISPKNLWWPPYTICGPRSLCRPSTLHHLNQLRRFARPSRLLTKFAYLAKTHMLHIRRLATRRHGRRQSVSRTGTVCYLLQSTSLSQSANKLYWATLLTTVRQLLYSATRSYDVHTSGSASSNWNWKLRPLPLDNDNYPSASRFPYRKRIWFDSWPSST